MIVLQPEGVEVVAELGNDGACWEWSIVQLGKNAEGKFYYRADEGCSCDWITDTLWIPLNEYSQIIEAANQWSHSYSNEKTVSKRAEFILKVREILNGQYFQTD